MVDGKFSSNWKKANIVPIYKGVNKREPVKLQISVTCEYCCQKMIKIVNDKGQNKRLEENNTMTDKRFTSRKGKECITSLISFYSSDIWDKEKRLMGVQHISRSRKKNVPWIICTGVAIYETTRNTFRTTNSRKGQRFGFPWRITDNETSKINKLLTQSRCEDGT